VAPGSADTADTNVLGDVDSDVFVGAHMTRNRGCPRRGLFAAANTPLARLERDVRECVLFYVQSSRLILEIFHSGIARRVAGDLHRVDTDRHRLIGKQHKCRTAQLVARKSSDIPWIFAGNLLARALAHQKHSAGGVRDAENHASFDR
jgi:hypothetical protein